MVVSIARHSEGFLAVRFPFDREVVDAMRTVPGRRWSAGDQAWLIPNGREEGGRLLNALYNTGMFSLSDSRDTSPADFFDETSANPRASPRIPTLQPPNDSGVRPMGQALPRPAQGPTLASLGEKDINAFLSHLAVDGNVSSSTQNQALAALLFSGRFWEPRSESWARSSAPRSRYAFPWS